MRAADVLEGIPFGTLYQLGAPDVLVPLGTQIRPAVSPEVLAERLGATGGAMVLFPDLNVAPVRILAGGDRPASIGACSVELEPALANLEPVGRTEREPDEPVEIENVPLGTDAAVGAGAAALTATDGAPVRRRSFCLPLVRGGALRVGRPLGPRAVARVMDLVASASRDPADDEAEPIAMLGAGRRARRGAPASGRGPPPLDEVTVRLGAALHDLLALAHPDLVGPGIGRRQEQIARGGAGAGVGRVACRRPARR